MKVALIAPAIGETIADGSLASVEKTNWLVNLVRLNVNPLSLIYLLQHGY